MFHRHFRDEIYQLQIEPRLGQALNLCPAAVLEIMMNCSQLKSHSLSLSLSLSFFFLIFLYVVCIWNPGVGRATQGVHPQFLAGFLDITVGYFWAVSDCSPNIPQQQANLSSTVCWKAFWQSRLKMAVKLLENFFFTFISFARSC